MFEFIRSQFTKLPYPTQDYTGKTVIVTGANVGLGLEAARHFVRLNAAKVILACRSIEKGEAAKEDIDTTTKRKGVAEVWQLDLSSYESIRDFCKRADKLDRVDVLVENAAVARLSYSQIQGHEATVTVNVISTFLTALLMLPVLRKSATRHNITPHLVVVSSEVHAGAKFKEQNAPEIFKELDNEKSDMMDRYPVSKLLEMLFIRELAPKMTQSGKPPVILNMLNPGLCHSELSRDMRKNVLLWLIVGTFKAIMARTTEMGSRNYPFAATATSDTHGKYFSNCVVAKESAWVRSEKSAETQKRVYSELMAILEDIEPGISNNI
ncbi:NAD(P)-binding protein [Zalerion maritima]|uniref:NAD(P)-binding protein n=1 Tax=Zalerion maritima TaxID=339359 RepID=A0AAD5WRT1_9PEZI|nr:NAD(P)-binding protein [Zalerion maritima]